MINNNHWQLAPQSKPALLITQLIVQTRFNQTMKIYNVYFSYYAGLHRLRGFCTDGQQNIRNISSDSQETDASLTLMGMCTLAGKSLIKGPFAWCCFSFVLPWVGIICADGKDDTSILSRIVFLSGMSFQSSLRVTSAALNKSSQPVKRNNFTPLAFSLSFCILADTCDVLISQNLACNMTWAKVTFYWVTVMSYCSKHSH